MAQTLPDEPYFVWNGLDSREMGLVVAAYPSSYNPEARVTEYDIPGRDGTLIVADGSYKSISLSVSCYIKPEANRKRLYSWLRGQGTVEFGNRPGYTREASIFQAISFDKLMRGYEWGSLTVPFKTIAYCHDADYGTNVEIQTDAVNGSYIQNPGDMSVPAIIEIHGTFDQGYVIAGGVKVELTDVEDGIVLDWEAQDCYELQYDEDTGEYSYLANANMLVTVDQSSPTGAQQSFVEGRNTITYAVTGTGSIDEIFVKNNWRYYG